MPLRPPSNTAAMQGHATAQPQYRIAQQHLACRRRNQFTMGLCNSGDGVETVSLEMGVARSGTDSQSFLNNRAWQLVGAKLQQQQHPHRAMQGTASTTRR
jgi:hypothetical protein